MATLPLASLFKIILEKRSSIRFLVGSVVSLAFSVAVILSTVGLMDGFELTLKKALSHSNGDIKFTAREGFFTEDEDLIDTFKGLDFLSGYSTILQIEAFSVSDEESKGILLKGITPAAFGKITGINTKQLKDGVLIGKQFQQKYQVKTGDKIVLAFASGRIKDQGSARLEELRVDGVVEHGIFEKDLRFMYMKKSRLENLVGYKPHTSNLGVLKIKDFENIKSSIQKLKYELGETFRFDPFWSEFEVLLEAVEIEKISISIVLQLIVLVAILNVVGFIIFLSETKAQDFFMLRALGLSVKSLQKFWFIILASIWGAACLLSFVFIYIFSEVILNLPFLKIPGDIYVLSDLDLILDIFDYVYVFGISFVWILIIGFFTIRKVKMHSLISGIRQEFS